MARNMTKIILCVFLFLGLSITSFKGLVFSEEHADNGLSISVVQILYHADSKNLQIKLVLMNTSNDNITVLTGLLDTELIKASNTYIIGKGGMIAKYKGYNIVESLYKFDPVTLRPKEATPVNHFVRAPLVKSPFDADKKIMVKYEIKEKFGKRFKVWYGAVESGPIKPRKVK